MGEGLERFGKVTIVYALKLSSYAKDFGKIERSDNRRPWNVNTMI